MRLLHFVFGALFGLSAYFQLNDPDALVWTSFYAFLALAAMLSGIFRPVKTLIWIGLGAWLILTMQSIPGAIEFATNKDGIGISQGMSNEYPYIEAMREFGGLLITMVWITIGLLWRTKLKHA